MENQKSFKEQYKDIRTASLIGIIAGLFFSLMGIIQMLTNMIDLASIMILIYGFCFCFYCLILFFFYGKFDKYQKNQQIIPKGFRVITGFFLIFYLTFYQNDKKNYRYYLFGNEGRFYILLGIFVYTLLIVIEYYAIKQGKTFGFLISLLVISIVGIIDLILMIFIGKYQGTSSKLLVCLTIITLNYRNYYFYKKIIEVNKKEKGGRK